jgi:hypothetical protein
MLNKIENIIKSISVLGPIMPGNITKQYNVCGKPNCKCKTGKDPIKHGPYYYLSFTFKGKGRTMNIPLDKINEIRKRNENYRKLKQLIDDLIEISIEQTREEIRHGK